jgi:signal transduction histidine kinase
VRLRTRIAVTTLAALVPLAAAFGVLFGFVRAQVVEGGLTQYAYAVAPGLSASCEAAPDRFGGPIDVAARIGPPPFLRGLEVYPYDASGRSSHPSAPALPPALVVEMMTGEPHASRRGDWLEVLVPGADSGSCAELLFRRRAQRPVGAPVDPPILVAALCSVVVLAVVLASLGPIARRILRLRDEVRVSAASGYRHEVTIGGSDELAELASAFADSGRQIARHLDAQERREQTLREFVANTTHDVMLPLTVLQGHLAALGDGTAPGDAAAALGAAMQEADYIASLVRNLEVAARLDAGEPEVARDPIELSPLLVRVISRHAPLARRRAVELLHAVPEPSPVAIGDLTLIEQAISNVVQNAVLYNHARGHVAAIVEMDGAQRFRISIKDDGPGIPPDELARVLDRGQRGDAARTRNPHGSGLGLSITARVAAAHAGPSTCAPGRTAASRSSWPARSHRESLQTTGRWALLSGSVPHARFLLFDADGTDPPRIGGHFSAFHLIDASG